MAKAKAKSKTASKSTGRASKSRTSGSKASNSRTKSKKVEMSNGSMLEEFFLDALKDIYYAEKALTKALPRLAKAATSQELKNAFNDHLEVTKGQIERLEQVFEKLGEKAQGKKCEAMVGLIEESESIISETESDTFTRDVGLIIAAQKVEHYEIASYGGLVQLAKTIDKKAIANLLEATLKEEKETDVLLTEIAEKNVNLEAATEAPEGGAKEGFLEKLFS